MNVNIASALAIQLRRDLTWDNAEVSDAALPVVGSTSSLFDFATYAQRDFQLSYRDLIVAGAISKLAMLGNNLYGARFTRLALPVTVSGDLSTDDCDFGYQTPGTVRQVVNGDDIAAAAQADIDLTERDALIYYLAYLTGLAAFDPPPLAALAELPAALTDAWSMADGSRSRGTVSAGYFINPSLFNRPDFNLADRDNQLAAWAAKLTNELQYPLDRATRVALTATYRAAASETEFYNLISDDGRYRIFSGWPQIPTRYILSYDKFLKTVNWRGEGDTAVSGPLPYSTAFVTGSGGYVSLAKRVPGKPDCEYYRQKSARLVVRPYRDTVSIRVDDIENYVISGAVYQTDGAVLARSGLASFSVPAPIQPGVVRISLLVEPIRTFDVLGFQNTAGTATGTAVDIAPGASVTWAVTIPAGQYYLDATFSDPTGATQAFPLALYYNNNLIFDGSWAYNRTDNADVTTQAFEFQSAGGPAILRLVRLDGTGDLRLEKFSLTSRLPPALPVQYILGAQLGAYAAPLVSLNGILDRTESLFFDIALPQTLVAPILTVNFFGAAGVALKVYGYDVRTYEGVQPLPEPDLYEGAKATLLRRAISAVAESWPYPTTDYATNDVALGRILDSSAYNRWLNVIKVGQPRLDQAFQVAGPGDIGRPALVPAGLEPTDTGDALLVNSAALGTPCLRVCQPWMVRFNVLVAGPDFWPLPFRAAESVSGAFVVSAGFDFTIFDTADPLPSIANMTAISYGVNAPDSDNFSAYSIANTGVGGGYNRQTCDVTVYANNLRTGAIYTVLLNLRTTPAVGGSPVLSSLAGSLSATGQVGLVSFTGISASDGYIVEVIGASLS